MIRIDGCTIKGKKWKLLMGWYVGSMCMQAYDPNTLFLDNSLATMGVGLPSVATACLFHPKKKVVAICGASGFMLNSKAKF
jgi:thiamine pyrophosphate-dependent acetolactate synthase large subunit-like protein